MRPILAASLLAAGLALAAPPARAQGVHCEGRLQVDPVTVSDIPGSREGGEARRQFSVGLRNLSGQAMLVFIRVSQLPGVPMAGSREVELPANTQVRQGVLNAQPGSSLTTSQVQAALQFFCR